MTDSAYEQAQIFLVRVMRDMERHFTDAAEATRAIILHLGERDVPSEIVAVMRSYIGKFAEDVVSGRIDPFHEQPWEKTIAVAAPPQDEEAEARALIEQLITQTGLYASSEAVKELLAFVNRLRNFAPFNAMLLHIQKPGLTHAATARDWWGEFRRMPMPHARPLLILRTMGPVDFVFDVLDTEGQKLPESAFCFPVLGDMGNGALEGILRDLERMEIYTQRINAGDAQAGSICSMAPPFPSKYDRAYLVRLNRNHSAAQQFVTLAHELAHLFLGHLGEDRSRKIPDRQNRPLALREVEAETVAYIVAHRNGMTPRSESYLDRYKGSFAALDLHAVMRAANRIETAIGEPASRFRASMVV